MSIFVYLLSLSPFFFLSLSKRRRRLQRRKRAKIDILPPIRCSLVTGGRLPAYATEKPTARRPWSSSSSPPPPPPFCAKCHENARKTFAVAVTRGGRGQRCLRYPRPPPNCKTPNCKRCGGGEGKEEIQAFRGPSSCLHAYHIKNNPLPMPTLDEARSAELYLCIFVFLPPP